MGQTFDSDVRFGSSYLSVGKHKQGVLGEILSNKLTGEIYIKRPVDGKIVSFRQKSHTVYEAIQEFNIQFQSSVGFIHPESPGSYLLGVKMCVDELNDNPKDILKEYHEFSKNDYKYKDFIFGVSGETNGFYIKPVTRLGDRNVCGFLSGLFAEHEITNFSTVSKSFEDWLFENPLYNDTYLYTEWKSLNEWSSSNTLVDCVIEVSGIDSVGNMMKNEESFTVAVNMNEFSYVGFPEDYNLGMELVLATTVTIKKIYSPKLEYERFLANDTNATSGINPIIDNLMEADDIAVLQSVDLFYFITGSSQLPFVEDMIIDQCIDVEFLDKAIVYLSTSSGARSFQVSPYKPDAFPIDTVWAEEIRNVNTNEGVVTNDTETTLEQLEETLYFETSNRARFTTHIIDTENILVTKNDNSLL